MKLPVVAVIMAGGSGERFWPLSRQSRPKQLLRLTNKMESLLDQAVNRLLPIIPADHIFIATNQTLQPIIQAGIKQIPPENVIGEPVRRNTSGCLVFAASHALARFQQESEDLLMAVVTADHLIGNENRFRQTVEAALNTAEKEHSLTTIGIQPARPDQGFGYIEVNEKEIPVDDTHGIFSYPVISFREKPSAEAAEKFVEAGNFYWNSGMFFWRISAFRDSLIQSTPALGHAVNTLADLLRAEGDRSQEILNVFESLPNISIDYALMEKAPRVSMTVGDFPWDDVGSWDSLSRTYPKNEDSSITVGDPILVNCENVIVYNEPTSERMAVGVVGLKNIIVVTSPDGVLVCSSDQTQEVKKVVERLKERNAVQL